MLLDSPMSGLSAKPLGPTPAGLSGREKAAIVVRLLLQEGAVPALTALPDSKQTELAVQLARMAPVDQDTVAAVAAEFAEAIESIGLSFPTELDGAIGLLEGVLSTSALSRLRQMGPTDFRGDPWELINNVDTDRLAPYLESEAVEIAAVILSKLKVSKAAELLGRMPGERARRITYAVSLTGGVAPGIVSRIGRSLAEQLEARPPRAFSDGPVSRVGAILNYAPASVRDDVLTGLDNEDKPFADQVRASIFTFANIPDRIAPRDIPRIQRDLEQDDLSLILAAAKGDDAKAAEFILANISKRLAENLRDEAKDKKDVTVADMEAAMLRVVSVIGDLEKAGEIFFVAADV